MKFTPGPWNWHDSFGRVNGEGPPKGIGRGITGDEPRIGNCSRFSYAVSDADGFCVAHCTGPLVTMSTERSEANARLIAKAPEYELALMAIANMVANETTNYRELAALCVATARMALEQIDK